MGGVGTGQTAKLANQLIVATTINDPIETKEIYNGIAFTTMV
uniref:2-hydroxy-3-oxopropionate reductase (EC) n=1 Tax=uncultured Thiotrichaceae bacterium TaxID=298394 RepID=A0A6S6UF16_9GAMM|nr:MAG: 2-hydroxy-3-oxopropionate reductase (EC [uncultured Thiotrichaceae bacterium]